MGSMYTVVLIDYIEGQSIVELVEATTWHGAILEAKSRLSDDTHDQVSVVAVFCGHHDDKTDFIITPNLSEIGADDEEASE